MTPNQFDHVLKLRLAAIGRTLDTKGQDYRGGTDDVLHNFRVASAMNGGLMHEQLWGMLTKHIVSIRDGCLDGRPRPIEWWSEKLGDAINYLILLEACVIEETGA